MTTNASTITIASTSGTPTRPTLWWPGVGFAAAGAAAATLTAAAAHAAGASLEIAGEAIPLPGFTQLAFVFSLIGVLIAAGLRRWSDRPRTLFVRSTVVLLVLSFVPDLITPDMTTATRIALIATHVVAAAIVIPGIASRLR
jgi:hypothetical protein